jgi:hypothetical protein
LDYLDFTIEEGFFRHPNPDGKPLHLQCLAHPKKQQLLTAKVAKKTLSALSKALLCVLGVSLANFAVKCFGSARTEA